jgi:hypothetical protein
MTEQVARTVIWSLLSLVTGASCVANLGSLTGVANINDTSKVDGNDGVMVATIEANVRGNVAVISTRDSRLFESLWVEPGRNFKIIKLPGQRANAASSGATGRARCVEPSRHDTPASCAR